MYNRERPIPKHPGTPGKRKWICRVCGFLYDEAVGDAKHGLPAGTTWEQIPSDWICPVCRVTKSDFDPFLD
ncbi:MAG: rubredoxin [Fibrobacterota bacterium]